MKEFKIIPSGKTARQLLKLGFTIVDVKANKANKEKTIFIFKNCKELEDIMKTIDETTMHTEGEQHYEHNEEKHKEQKRNEEE